MRRWATKNDRLFNRINEFQIKVKADGSPISAGNSITKYGLSEGGGVKALTNLGLIEVAFQENVITEEEYAVFNEIVTTAK